MSALRPGRRLLPLLALLLASCASAGTATPEAPTVEALSGDGPYDVSTYAAVPEVPEFADATIYHPTDAPGPLAGVAVAPGYTEEQRHVAWLGPRLASHGYVVLTLDTNDPEDDPAARAEALIAAVRLLKSEHARRGSPLFGRLDADRMAVAGHSMGGGGALLAADRHPDEVRAVIPVTPWLPEGDFRNVEDPTLVIAGSADGIAAVDEHAWPHFRSIPESTPKVYLEIDGGGHFIADSERGEDLATVGRYVLAWLGLHLSEDERYRDVLHGEVPDADGPKFSRYVTSP